VRLSGFAGLGELAFPSGVSTLVGQLQQLVNGAKAQGRLSDSGPNLTVNGRGDAALMLALGALVPGAGTPGEAIRQMRALGFRYVGAGGLEEDPFQAPAISTQVTVTNPTTGKKTTKIVKKPAPVEPEAAPPVPWWQSSSAQIGAVVAAGAAAAYLVFRRKRRR